MAFVVEQNQWWLVVVVIRALHTFSLFHMSDHLLEMQINWNLLWVSGTKTHAYFYVFFQVGDIDADIDIDDIYIYKTCFSSGHAAQISLIILKASWAVTEDFFFYFKKLELSWMGAARTLPMILTESSYWLIHDKLLLCASACASENVSKAMLFKRHYFLLHAK